MRSSATIRERRGSLTRFFRKYAGVVGGADPDPANVEKMTKWCKDYSEALHPYSSGGAYSNFMMDEGHDRVKASYKNNYDRLVSIKNKYDPENLFRVNQNIKPSL
ncbi:MAG: BBE domain-containing protein [Ignavibacteriaceae bacterium]